MYFGLRPMHTIAIFWICFPALPSVKDVQAPNSLSFGQEAKVFPPLWRDLETKSS